MDKDKPAGSSAQPARASTGTLQQSAAGKRAAKGTAGAARNSAAEAMAAAQAETEITELQASSGYENSTDEATPAPAALLRIKISENTKMQRIAELETQLVKKAQATKGQGNIQSSDVYIVYFLLYFLTAYSLKSEDDPRLLLFTRKGPTGSTALLNPIFWLVFDELST